MKIDTAILIALISAFSSSGVMSLVIFLLQRRDRKKEKESAQSRMIIALGHDKIIYLTDKYVRRGAITLKEKKNLKYLGDPYFDGGGNGDAKIGYDACRELPVVSDDAAEEMDMIIKRKEYGFDDEQSDV